MGTITHRGGKNKEALSHLCSETPNKPLNLSPPPPILYCFFASSFVRLRRYGSSLAAGGTAIYQIHWKSAVSPHCPFQPPLVHKDLHSPLGWSSSEELLARH